MQNKAAKLAAVFKVHQIHRKNSRQDTFPFTANENYILAARVLTVDNISLLAQPYLCMRNLTSFGKLLSYLSYLQGRSVFLA